jgi:hypothetical protein
MRIRFPRFDRTPAPGRYEDPQTNTVVVVHEGHKIETIHPDPSMPITFTYCDNPKAVRRCLRAYGSRLQPQRKP